MGLGRLLYAARAMDGQSVPGWLGFGAGRGRLCSPRLSWLGRWAAARGSPGRCAPWAAPPRPPARSLKLEGRRLRSWPQRANSGSAKQGRGRFQQKEQGVPTSLCYKGPGPHISWVKGRDLGPSATTFSPLSWGQALRQGQRPAQLWAAWAALPSTALLRPEQPGGCPGPRGSGRLHPEKMRPPGQQQLPRPWLWSLQSGIQGSHPWATGALQSPCLGCILHSCWLLLAPGSSPEQILC